MTLKQSKPFMMSVALATAMSGFAFGQTNTQASQQPNSQSQSQMQSQSKMGQMGQYSQTEVRAAQQKLKDDGYYTGKIDGEDGPETQAAIKKYQQSQNLKVTGQLDKETCQKLGVQQGQK
jgi:peptidoglycan hydrolase-like protein with peptidoglycan-binding domain